MLLQNHILKETGNLDGMVNFLDRYQIDSLNQDQINLLNCPITPNVIETVISQPNKAQNQVGLVQRSIRPSNKIPILSRLFHNIETEGSLPNSFYGPTIALIPKAHKDPTKKDNF